MHQARKRVSFVNSSEATFFLKEQEDAASYQLATSGNSTFLFSTFLSGGIKSWRGSPSSRFPPSFTPKLSVPSLPSQRMTLKHLVPLPKSTSEPNDDFPFPIPHFCVSTALISLEAAGRWRLSLCFQVISQVWAAQNQMLVLIPTVHRDEQQNLTHCSILQVHGFR